MQTRDRKRHVNSGRVWVDCMSAMIVTSYNGLVRGPVSVDALPGLALDRCMSPSVFKLAQSEIHLKSFIIIFFAYTEIHLTQGVSVMATGAKNAKSQMTTVRIPHEVMEDIDRLREDGESTAGFLVTAAKSEIKRRQRKQNKQSASEESE